MSNITIAQENKASTAPIFSKNGVLQRKCNCGQKKTASDACPQCKKRIYYYSAKRKYHHHFLTYRL